MPGLSSVGVVGFPFHQYPVPLYALAPVFQDQTSVDATAAVVAVTLTSTLSTCHPSPVPPTPEPSYS